MCAEPLPDEVVDYGFVNVQRRAAFDVICQGGLQIINRHTLYREGSHLADTPYL